MTVFALLLLTWAIYLNKDDKKMLLLTLLVGLSYLLPVHLITNMYVWYGVVMGAELFVLLSAICLRTNASVAVATVCAMLLVNHLNGLFFNGYLENSPYQIIVPYLEYIELLACSLFASKTINKLKGLYNARY